MRAPRRMSVSPSAPAGEGDHDAFARLPGAADPVFGAVRAQGAVDLVGEPEQREFAEGGEVAQAEVVRQGRIDPLGRVHDPGRQAVAQRLGCEVDHLDLIRCADDGIRDGLALGDAGDLLDDVVERLDVLDVDGRDDVDAGIQELLHVLPALLVARTGRVGVGEFVDERDARRPLEDSLEVHFAQLDAAVRHDVARHDRKALDERGRRRTTVGLDDRDDDVRLRRRAGACPPRASRRSCRRRERRRAAPAAAPASSPTPSVPARPAPGSARAR